MNDLDIYHLPTPNRFFNQAAKQLRCEISIILASGIASERKWCSLEIKLGLSRNSPFFTAAPIPICVPMNVWPCEDFIGYEICATKKPFSLQGSSGSWHIRGQATASATCWAWQQKRMHKNERWLLCYVLYIDEANAYIFQVRWLNASWCKIVQGHIWWRHAFSAKRWPWPLKHGLLCIFNNTKQLRWLSTYWYPA